jgi:hypothetical protein
MVCQNAENVSGTFIVSLDENVSAVENELYDC